MSKVALTGNAQGTGILTIAAPNTNQTRQVTLPVHGTHFSASLADGMPLLSDNTPVVESGSNTDGNWTKFGDGTLICNNPAFADADTTESVTPLYRSSVYPVWTYPAAFIESPSAAVNQRQTASDRWVSIRDVSLTQLTVIAWGRTSSTALISLGVMATGRWK